jgi:HxlR-like helix-turn-helix protein
METDRSRSLELSLLLHLLEFRGHQVRFEADQRTTEFGIFRAFPSLDAQELKNALRTLENTRLIYRRVQYVVGFSEPKLVYSLTPSGHRKALDFRREETGEPVGSGTPGDGNGGEGDRPSAFSLSSARPQAFPDHTGT